MFDFGDDLTIATLSIPWLLWIQILILILLLFFFGLFSPDLVADSGGSSSSSISRSEKPAPVCSRGGGSVIANPLQNSQVGGRQSLRGGIGRGTSRSVCVGVGQVGVEDTEGYESSEGTEGYESSEATDHVPLHPCHYFRLAKLAFLKCLGLDSLRQ